MQSEAYAQKVKQMANTLIYIQEHGYETRKDLSAVTSEAQERLTEAYDKKRELTGKMKVLNSQIHYTGQYFASKNIYAEFLKSGNKKNFRSEHVSEITAYEEARDWLKDFYPDGKMLSLKSLKERKQKLQETIDSQKTVIHNYKNQRKEYTGDNLDRLSALCMICVMPETNHLPRWHFTTTSSTFTDRDQREHK